MKHITFFIFSLLLAGYIQAARVTVTNHDGSVQNFNCACSCAEVAAYTAANPNEFRSVSCADRQAPGGNGFNEAAECTQNINEVEIVIPSVKNFPPKPTPTDPGIPADVKDLFLMYELSANKVRVVQVSEQSDWKSILNGITFIGAKKSYMFFYGKAADGHLKINNQKVPVKKEKVSAKIGDLLINDVLIPDERRGPGTEPEKPKGCCCIEEPTPGNFTMQNVDCPGGDCVKCCADAKKAGGKTGPAPQDIVEAIQKGQHSGTVGGKNYHFSGGSKPKGETLSMADLAKDWDKKKYPYGIVVFNDSYFGYDKADNVIEWMKNKDNLLGKTGMPAPVFVIPVVIEDPNAPVQAANGAGTRSAIPSTRNKPGLRREVVLPPPTNTPLFPPIQYKNDIRLVKCYDKDGNEYYVNCPQGTEYCCDLAPLPTIIDLGGDDQGMQGNNGGGGSGGNVGDREPVLVVIYKDETYAVSGRPKPTKPFKPGDELLTYLKSEGVDTNNMIEAFFGTAKKGAKVDTDIKNAKRLPLPSITTTIPEEPQDPQEARGCRRLGCTTVNCRKCREYQEKLKQGDPRDIQLQ